MNFNSISVLLAVICLVACANPNSQEQAQNTSDSTKSGHDDKTNMKRILFFGNSLTAGYGLENTDNAFPGLIQNKIDSLNLPYQTVNAGLSGETTSGGNERVDWLLNQKIDIFVLELGANDGLRGLPVDETYTNLQSIIDKVKAAWPECKIVLTGMLVPPSMGQEYAESFRQIFPQLAEENDLAFVSFLLENVAGEVELNQDDGIHPTKEGQRIMAENVWEVLYPLL
ncbi:arylesterase [Albibacterium profundi]|uniref:Arylesterase n=1 Tax=Albibacterium profundi TaxID=3134906 RepID=A0ABV5CFY9_9SPHI